jgi:hypothetical protein
MKGIVRRFFSSFFSRNFFLSSKQHLNFIGGVYSQGRGQPEGCGFDIDQAFAMKVDESQNSFESIFSFDLLPFFMM